MVVAAVGIAATLGMGATSAAGVFANDIAQDVTAWLVAIAVVAGRGGVPASMRRVTDRIALVLLLAALGLTLQDAGGDLGSPVAHGCFVAAIAVYIVSVSVEIGRDVPGDVLLGAWLDALILFVAATLVAGVAWQGASRVAAPPIVVLAVQAMLVLGAWAAAASLILLARGLAPARSGAWLVLAGGLAVGIGAAAWEVVTTAPGTTRAVVPADPLIPVGLIAAAGGVLTWAPALATAPRPGLLRWALDVIPMASVLVTLGLELTAPATPDYAFVRIGVVGTVVAGGIRHILVRAAGRRAAAAEAMAHRRLAEEAGDRHATLRSLTRLEAGATPAETARRVCEEAVALESIDAAWLALVGDDGVPRAIASAGLPPAALVGRAVETGSGAEPVDAGSVIVWLQRPGPDATGHLADLHAGGIRAALTAPFHWEERLVGYLGVGTRDEAAARDLARRAATSRELAVIAAALLGPSIGAAYRERSSRARIGDLVAGRGFRPVYQPIAEVATRRVVGHEALTRFDDGRRPDEVFAEARAVNLGLELEVATLIAALDASATLPQGTYLSLNLSPELASSAERLGPVLRHVRRDLVLEITEHVPVTDYARLLTTLYALGIKVRLAVDDAGAGYAGLQHILAIRPQLIKLDTSLVRHVDDDLARQALIEGMVSFASRIGALVVGEGVETEAEAEALAALRVPLMQGFLLGRPEPAPGVDPERLAAYRGAPDRP